jgi:hypothetical protein
MSPGDETPEFRPIRSFARRLLGGSQSRGVIVSAAQVRWRPLRPKREGLRAACKMIWSFTMFSVLAGKLSTIGWGKRFSAAVSI